MNLWVAEFVHKLAQGIVGRHKIGSQLLIQGIFHACQSLPRQSLGFLPVLLECGCLFLRFFFRGFGRGRK